MERRNDGVGGREGGESRGVSESLLRAAGCVAWVNLDEVVKI